MLAAACAVNPSYAPCGKCECIDGVNPIPNKWEIDGVLVTNICPRRQLPADWAAIARMFRFYRNGILWTAGGLADQSALYAEVMDLVDTSVAQFSKGKQ